MQLGYFLVMAEPVSTWVQVILLLCPRHAPLFSVEIRGERKALATHLDTFLVDADERSVELVWRAAFPLPKKAGMIGEIEVRGDRSLPHEVLGTVEPEPAGDDLHEEEDA